MELRLRLRFFFFFPQNDSRLEVKNTSSSTENRYTSVLVLKNVGGLDAETYECVAEDDDPDDYEDAKRAYITVYVEGTSHPIHELIVPTNPLRSRFRLAIISY